MSDWLTAWPTAWPTAWLIDWLTDRLTDWLTDSTDWLTDWLTDRLTDWLINWLADWLTDNWFHYKTITTKSDDDDKTSRSTVRTAKNLQLAGCWPNDWMATRKDKRTNRIGNTKRAELRTAITSEDTIGALLTCSPFLSAVWQGSRSPPSPRREALSLHSPPCSLWSRARGN